MPPKKDLTTLINTPRQTMDLYAQLAADARNKKQLLGILLDPEKFPLETVGTEVQINRAFAKAYIYKLPSATTHLLLGGSSNSYISTDEVAMLIKEYSDLPLLLFPGDHSQLSAHADAILFLSLLSGRNPDYLIGQQVKAAPVLHLMNLEIIPTGYILINGKKKSAVERTSGTKPMPQRKLPKIVATALAAQYLGKKLVYLEAGSGAKRPVQPHVIEAVAKAIDIPLVVGGGIRTSSQLEAAYSAGADMVIVGTAFEEDSWNSQSS